MRFFVLAAAASLAACSAENASSSPPDQFAREAQAPAEAAAQGDGSAAAPGRADAPAKLPVSIPQLSYSYALSYLIPGEKIAAAQDAHRQLCEEMGPARCQLIGLERGVGTERENSAMLKLRVASAEARRFQVLLDHDVAEVGGRSDNARIGTEEVSKQIVDSEARIRQRELLVSRLTEALRKRSGRPAELVEAERSVTQAQEELDQARGWLAELRGRVAMSEFEIHYAAIAPTASARNIGAELGEAMQGSGAAFLIGTRMLLSLAIYLLPWFLLLALPVFLLHAWRKRSAAAV